MGAMAEAMVGVERRRCEGSLADGSPCPEPPLDPLPGSGRPPQYCWTHTSAATRSTRLRRLGEAPAVVASAGTADLPASVGGLLEQLAALEPAAQEVLRSAKAAAAAASAVSDAAADLEPSVVAGHVEQIRRAAADQVRDAGAQLALMEERLAAAEAGRVAAEVDRVEWQAQAREVRGLWREQYADALEWRAQAHERTGEVAAMARDAVALAGARDEAVSELDRARQALARAVEALQAARDEATQAAERAVVLAGERDNALAGLATAQESLARAGEDLEAARARAAATTGRADALVRERDRAVSELDETRLALQQAREESAAARARAETLEAVSSSLRPRVGPVSGPRRSRRRLP